MSQVQVCCVFTTTLGHGFLCGSLFAGVRDLHGARSFGFVPDDARVALSTESGTLSAPCWNTISIPLKLNNLTAVPRRMPSLVEVNEWFHIQPVPADASAVPWLQSSGEEILARDGMGWLVEAAPLAGEALMKSSSSALT